MLLSEMFLNNMTKIDMTTKFNSNKLMFELTKFQDGSSHSVKKTKSSRLIFFVLLGSRVGYFKVW